VPVPLYQVRHDPRGDRARPHPRATHRAHGRPRRL